MNLNCERLFAHIEGHTEFDYILGENKLVTAGIEGEIRLWSLNDFQVQECFNDDSDPIYSVLATQNRVFIASSSNRVKSFSLPDFEDEQTVCRFTANATALHLTAQQQKPMLAAGAADFSIKLINLEDRTEKTFEGHAGPILSLALDPQNKFLASSACDGTVCMWSTNSKSILHTWRNVFPRSNDFENSPTLARIAFRPETGDLFALPKHKPATLELYKRGEWDKATATVAHESMTKNNPDVLLSLIAFSTDGSLLGVATTSSMVLIWKTSDVLSSSTAAPISIFNGKPEVPFTCFKFSSINPLQFCVADKTGELYISNITAPEVAPKKPADATLDDETIEAMLNDDFEEDFMLNFDETKKSTTTTTTTTVQEKSSSFSETATINHRTTTVEKQSTKTTIDEIVSLTMSKEQQEAAASVVRAPTNNQLTSSLEDALDEDFNAEFDIGAIKSQYEQIIFGDDREKPAAKSASKGGSSGAAVTALSGEFTIDGHRVKASDLLSMLRQHQQQQQSRSSGPTRQAAFQSGSTPIHYKRRFMVWNSVGIVYGHNTEEERSIDVEFHDVSYHHSIHMVNHLNYSIADLSTACLLLASNGDDEAEDELEHSKARLYVQMFNSWDAAKEWTVEFARDESVEAVAASTTFVAVATSLQYLRIWTVSGIQTAIISLNGPVVNLSSYERFLMVLAHQGSPAATSPQGSSGDQWIAVQVLKVDHKGKTRAHPVPTPVPLALSPRSTAVWAGFTDEGTPAVMDSDGVVRLYKTHFGSGWFPVCATKEHGNGRSDNFFVIGLSEIQAQIRCIFCKASRYPDTVPKPTLTLLPLQVPLCELFTNKAKIEEEAIRSRWLGSLLKRLSTDGYDVDAALEDADKRVVNSLIKLFALALGADREALALEIAKIMPNRGALEGAVRYAERQKHRSLAMKLIEMMQDEETADGESDLDEQNSDTELQELMVRKSADQARQLLALTEEEESQNSNSRMVALAKLTSASGESGSATGNSTGGGGGFVQLKPKALGMRGQDNSVSMQSTINYLDDDDDDDIGGKVVALGEDDDDDNANDGSFLRPMRMTSRQASNKENGGKNPFKVVTADKNKNKSTNQRMRESALKRKKFEVEAEEEDEDEEEAITGEDSNDGGEAFKNYLKSVRDQLLEDNIEEIETEDDLLAVAKVNFGKLSEAEKRKLKKGSLISKRSAKQSSSKRSKQAELKKTAEAEAPKVNKITNFFGRNNNN